MLTRFEDGAAAEQALRNLHFLIELELQKARFEDAASDAATKPQDVLRRMMDMEETLRFRLILAGNRHGVHPEPA